MSVHQLRAFEDGEARGIGTVTALALEVRGSQLMLCSRHQLPEPLTDVQLAIGPHDSPVSVVAISDRYDLALLAGWTESRGYQLADRLPAVGSRATICGCPRSWRRWDSGGVFERPNGILRVATPPDHIKDGFSGGCVLDHHGRLAGILCRAGGRTAHFERVGAIVDLIDSVFGSGAAGVDVPAPKRNCAALTRLDCKREHEREQLAHRPAARAAGELDDSVMQLIYDRLGWRPDERPHAGRIMMGSSNWKAMRWTR